MQNGGICVIAYKIGLSKYLDSNGDLIDKNSGVYEYKLILNELAEIEAPDSIVVINGKKDGDTEELKRFLKKFKNIIFILSDPIAFDENKDIIEMSTHVLHQCPMSNLDLPQNIDQRYSYVPELFYKEDLFIPGNNNKLLFGGGVRDNEAKIYKYLSMVPSDNFIKSNDFDNRLPYNEYKREVAKRKYNLIVARKMYERIGWITARYFETLACHSLPVVDEEYDKYDWLNCIKVNTKTVKSFIQRMEHSDDLYDALLISYRENVDTKGFYNTIKNIVGG